MINLITTLVGEQLEEGEGDKWGGTLAAPNGSVYGIPSEAPRVAKFNPVDKSIAYIGPDFPYGNWYKGAMTDNGIIYCPPYEDYDRGILKIDTNTDTATELNRNLLPEQGVWASCAAALDGCIYFMPTRARRIMKLDPNNNDAMSSVGDDLGSNGSKYSGTVVGIDGCVYGIPFNSNRIPKYDPINEITSFVGEEADEALKCEGDGALGRDDCIYALAKDDRVLKIDTTNNSHGFVGNSVDSDHHPVLLEDWGDVVGPGWGDTILGIDGCVYWPPYFAMRTLKYDPHTDLTSLVGGAFSDGHGEWYGGALAMDGVIYCFPKYADQVLAIDPWGEFLETTKANMEDRPETFGFIFQKITEVREGSTLHESQTNFDHAIVKFGYKEVYEVLETSMKPVDDYCKETNLCPFMIVASYAHKGTSTLSAINHLIRRDLSWVNNCTSSLESKTLTNKKRKHNSLLK